MDNLDAAQKQPIKTNFLLVPIIIVIVIGIGAFVFFQQLPNFTGTFSASSENPVLTDPAMQSDVIDPSQFLSREDYFREVFMPHRGQYNLFEKAAGFLKKPVSEMPVYFDLKNEQEIFEELPQIPDDFSETAYLLAQGQYFSLGLLDETYYKQPEFYSNFKTIGVRYWTRPDPKYWVANGYGTYPAEQWDVLEKGKREEFSSVVFFYSSWGVQSFQGISLRPSTESQKYFDIKITPGDFLLEPNFPKFKKNWAYRIEITGKPKPGTPPGTYSIGINVEIPPKELKEKWTAEHTNLYFDGATAIKPSGNQIQLNVTLK